MINFPKIKANRRGFTLIELLIYSSILAVMLALMTAFLWNIIFGNIKETSYLDIQQNGRFALTKISQEIKKATGVNSPAPGDSASVLSLTVATPSLTPTVFDLDNGKLRITRGSSGSAYLTSDEIEITDLRFINLSYTSKNELPTIRVEMTVNRRNPENRAEYQAVITLKSTVVLLPGGMADASAASHLSQTHYRWRNDDGRE